MSLTSWLAKRQVKEVLKGVYQAVMEFIDELLTSKDNRKDTTSRVPTAHKIDNHYPTRNELIKKQAHDILKGNK